jgi:hypothetical protein
MRNRSSLGKGLNGSFQEALTLWLFRVLTTACFARRWLRFHDTSMAAEAGLSECQWRNVIDLAAVRLDKLRGST